jgi:iron complex outermembrane receptor protein
MAAKHQRIFTAARSGLPKNTANLDFDRNFGNQIGIPSFKVSFGMEFRIENYRITEGEEASYATLPQYADSTYEPGAQVFSGLQAGKRRG